METKKFQPQSLTCPKCGTQHQIITEDISSRKIRSCRLNIDTVLHLCVQLKCPDCQKELCLCFVEKTKVNGETMFECQDRKNAGLQMWKRIEEVKIMMPLYQPNTGNRTDFEHGLDEEAIALVNIIYPWQNQAAPAGTLAELLGEVDDYTTQIKWRQFKKRPLVAVFCAHEGEAKYYKGFNGLFNRVKSKNQVLKNEFVSKLGGNDEDYPKHYCNNKIGHCAEAHAANSCLNAEPRPDTNDLCFSIAYQCRTAEPRSYCLNCITLFQNVRNA